MSALATTRLPGDDGFAPTGFELDDARAMIGRRLVLRRPLLEFETGTPCRVQCVVDFGDGLLLWVTTADERQADVDQIDADDLKTFFEVVERSAGGIATPGAPMGEASNDIGPWNQPQGLWPGRWLRTAATRLGSLMEALAVSLELARYTERHMSMSDRQLAARGLQREQIFDHVRDRLCGLR